MAGVPFAVKNLFDIEGIVTLAGSKINRDHPAAGQDAIAIQTLEAAGAVLVGATNMDEYAYGFVTENAHYGATPNPLDPSRVSGGSSGGSAAAVAANLVPLALGSDTNGFREGSRRLLWRGGAKTHLWARIPSGLIFVR